MPRILYIEDNRENRMLVRRVLMASDHDFIVQEAENAHLGIEMAQAEPPDLILMDLSMPDMDGLTATQKIRAIPALHAIPIVALTANAMQGDKERSLSAGCDGYISKPIDVDKLPEDVFSFVGVVHRDPNAETVTPLPTQTIPTAPVSEASTPTTDQPPAQTTPNDTMTVPEVAAPIPTAIPVTAQEVAHTPTPAETAVSAPATETSPQTPIISSAPDAISSSTIQETPPSVQG